MSRHELIINNARQNNLKNISLKLPHNKVIAITGVSGSGKSSLAFETIFAEGQWRFIESLSTYARLFLEKLDRPLVDSIENIRPAIALEQRNPVRGSRSTVGTLTEIYDYLRMLFSKVSTPYCPNCGAEIRKWDTSSIVSELLERHETKKAVIVFESNEPFSELKQKGFYRAWTADGAKEFEEINEGKGKKFDIVVDRLVITNEPRLPDSIEIAWRHGGERLKVIIIDGDDIKFSSMNTCDSCGMELPEPTPLLFSFNHPVGACPECKGFGNVLRFADDLIVPDTNLSLAEGAIEPIGKPSHAWFFNQLLKGAKKAGVDVDKPYRELSKDERDIIYNDNGKFYGMKDFFDELENKKYKLHVRVFISRYRKAEVCPSCNGKRLSPSALAYKISGKDIAEVCALPVSGVILYFKDIDISSFQKDMSKELLRQIDIKLEFLHKVGLDYIGLSRQGRTLSGGEYQRINLSNQLASCLTGTLYVLDEPTIGLHRRDIDKISSIMSELSAIGNTIIVVEHDRSIIEKADWVVELGPGGGHKGGEVVFSGPQDEFIKSDTLTARYIKDIVKISRPAVRRTGRGSISLKGASGNNLKSADIEIPLHTLTSITGVSGSGKSSLIVETLERALEKHFRVGVETPLSYKSLEWQTSLKGVRLIDQMPIGKSPRSNPATYLKLFDPIRKLFAGLPESRTHGYSAGFFSFNVPGGRCEACKGEGYQKVEMYFFEDLYVKCEECGGKRYGENALKVAYRGNNISDVLNMTVSEGLVLFKDEQRIKSGLELMESIGLGYLGLGQPATTLSGGEAQRLKICAELGYKSAKDYIYILDEPTVGLHMKDVESLLIVLNKLVSVGNTVVAIEHNLDFVFASDWVIDLGPEGGEKGGRVIATGTPEDIAKVNESFTGKYLKEYV